MSGERRYAVVTNADGYYSIWPVGLALPAGWQLEGTTGSEQECADHVDQVWTGLDPASLRAGRG